MYQWLALIAIIIVPYILLRKFFPPPPSGKVLNVCGHLESLHRFGKYYDSVVEGSNNISLGLWWAHSRIAWFGQC